MVTSGGLALHIALGVVKVVVLAYDVITFPIYFLVQAPWKKWGKSNRIWAKRLEPDNPGSPYIRLENNNLDLVDGITTVADILKKAVKLRPHAECLGTREVFGEEDQTQPDGKVFKKLNLGVYNWLSYVQMDQQVEYVCRGLLSLGIKKGDRVVIFAETRAEWLIAAFACFRANILVVTLYATLGEDGIAYGINEAEGVIVFTTQSLLPKVKKIITKVPTVKNVVYMEYFGEPSVSGFPDSVGVMSFKELIKVGKKADIEEKPEPALLDDTAVIMYTSGSTGPPKGVLITHRNMLANLRAVTANHPAVKVGDTTMSFLPLAHIMELTTECFYLLAGVRLAYSSAFTLTDKSTAIKHGEKGDAVLAKPGVMLLVPLVLDRIKKNVIDTVSAKGPFVQNLFQFGLNYKKFWLAKGFSTPVLDRILFKKIHDMLGGRIWGFGTGSAPLSPSTHEFITTVFGCPLIQGYGLTETTGAASLMNMYDLSGVTVGPPVFGSMIKLVNWDEGNYHVSDMPNPRGEIIIGGDIVTAGYFKNDALTSEVFKEENGVRWFYTGDIGEFVPEGNLKIIDRKKDLVKLQYGEYISLGKVESELKTCALVDNLCIFANSFHDYAVALVQPNKEQLKKLSLTIGKGSLGFGDLIQDPAVTAAVLKALVEQGKKSNLNKFEIPQRCTLVMEEWLPDTGLVTAAMKLRRKPIQQYYQAFIDKMYSDTPALESVIVR